MESPAKNDWRTNTDPIADLSLASPDTDITSNSVRRMLPYFNKEGNQPSYSSSCFGDAQKRKRKRDEPSQHGNPPMGTTTMDDQMMNRIGPVGEDDGDGEKRKPETKEDDVIDNAFDASNIEIDSDSEGNGEDVQGLSDNEDHHHHHKEEDHHRDNDNDGVDMKLFRIPISGNRTPGALALPLSVQQNVERIVSNPRAAQREVEDTMEAHQERYCQLQQRLEEQNRESHKNAVTPAAAATTNIATPLSTSPETSDADNVRYQHQQQEYGFAQYGVDSSILNPELDSDGGTATTATTIGSSSEDEDRKETYEEQQFRLGGQAEQEDSSIPSDDDPL